MVPMVSPTAEAIESYRRLVVEGRVVCDVEACLRCGGKPEEFQIHERRKRTVLYLVERLIKKAVCLLVRWKCPLCQKTFTLYPDFVLRYKRYALPIVTGLCERYLEDDGLGYREAVLQNGMAVFHTGGDGAPLDERSLQASTLHRWVALFAELVRTRRAALRLVRRKSPSSGVFRKILPVVPWKHRSSERRRALQDACQLFLVEGEHRRLFGVSIFPRLATLCGWG